MGVRGERGEGKREGGGECKTPIRVRGGRKREWNTQCELGGCEGDKGRGDASNNTDSVISCPTPPPIIHPHPLPPQGRNIRKWEAPEVGNTNVHSAESEV